MKRTHHAGVPGMEDKTYSKKGSWLAVLIMTIGFAISGVAIVVASWQLFVVGLVVVAAGGFFGLYAGILNATH